MDKLFRFFIAGIATYGVSIGCTYILKELLLFSSELAYFIALSAMTIINFLISLYFTFRKDYRTNILLKYVFFLLVFATINYLSTMVLKNMLGEQYLYFIIFVITGILFFGKFVVYDRVIFTKFSK